MSEKITDFPPFTIQSIPFAQPKNDLSKNDRTLQEDSKFRRHKEAEELKEEGNQKENHGYYICSTGNIHVDEPPFVNSTEPSEAGAINNVDWLDEIAEKSISANNLVIAIHGYAVSDKGARNWYSRIFSYISGDAEFPVPMPESDRTLSGNTLE